MSDQLKVLINQLKNHTHHPTESVKLLGELIDHSGDAHFLEGLEFAKSFGTNLVHSLDDMFLICTTHYYLANVYGTTRRIENTNSQNYEHHIDDSEIENELLHLRQSYLIYQRLIPNQNHGDFICRVLTNLGNLLSHIGRYVEAIEYWEKAVQYNPTFSMAKGNQGYGLISYSGILYDNGHQALLLSKARGLITDALDNGYLDEGGIKEFFLENLKWLNSSLPDPTTMKLPPEESLGDSDEEIQYRTWTLNQRLFLNPLNDAYQKSFCANDVLTLPSITTKLEEGPHLHSFFNQLKQEYVSSRYLYYSSVFQSDEIPHYSDKDVLLYDTLDYPLYGLNIEKLKTSYSTSYSIFDKIAYLLNDFLKLQIPERRISFRSFWYEKQDRKKELRSEITASFNWPLRGLFWLSKDLYENKPGFQDSISPEAQEICSIRNHLAHKCFKVHGEDWHNGEHLYSSLFKDKLSYSIKIDNFEKKALYLLRLSRSALIYLSLAIHIEENKQSKNDQLLLYPVQLNILDDILKR